MQSDEASHGMDIDLPDFSIRELRNAIPTPCFERSASRGLFYLLRDVGALAVTFYTFNACVTPTIVPHPLARVLLWTLYTFLQGLFGTGVWVLAHECGHQSFSESWILNDAVGWVCHSALLVPYFSWKITHSKHHRKAGHMQQDTAFVPKTRDEYAAGISSPPHQLAHLAAETPLATAGQLVAMQLGGWPMYLMFYVTGRGRNESFFSECEGRFWLRSSSHFLPWSNLFGKQDKHRILLSDLGIGVMLVLLTTVVSRFGWANFATWYFAPYLWVNSWIGESSGGCASV